MTDARQIIADQQCIVTPRRVDDTFVATLGGAEQVVNVRGADRDNPLLVFVHGGPGIPMMPIVWTFQRPWEDFFTVVQYDQRGAGRSFALQTPDAPPPLSLDRYRDDAIELIEQLCARYGKRRVILLGHSWGSVIGLSVALARLDLLAAYVGVSQVVDFLDGERLSYAWSLDQAKRRGNAEAVAELEAIAPYPSATLTPAAIAIERRWLTAFGGFIAGRTTLDSYFGPVALSPLYDDAAQTAFLGGIGFTTPLMLPQLASIDFTGETKLAVPTVLIHGRHDFTTPSTLASTWFDRLQAPAKTWIWLERAAHLPMLEEPGTLLAALANHVRPLAG